jgi:hypothetical protein
MEALKVISLLMGSEPEDGLVHLHIWSETAIVPWITGVSYRTGSFGMQLTANTDLLGAGVLPIETVSFIAGKSPEFYAPTEAFTPPVGTIGFLRLAARTDQNVATLEMTLPTNLKNSEWSGTSIFSSPARLFVDTWYMGRAVEDPAILRMGFAAR